MRWNVCPQMMVDKNSMIWKITWIIGKNKTNYLIFGLSFNDHGSLNIQRWTHFATKTALS